MRRCLVVVALLLASCGARTGLGSPRDASVMDATRDAGRRDAQAVDAQAGVDLGCMLPDSDGDGASACTDCNDADPRIRPGEPEVCDGRDQDCNGTVDEGVTTECGTCERGCRTLRIPGPTGWTSANGSGVSVDPNGALTLSSTRRTSNSAWIANYLFATVTRLDTRDGAQVAEYDSALVLPSNHAAAPGTQCEWTRPGGNCPSRTAVDLRGAVYVANRAFMTQGTVTKIAGFEEDCVDRNGNGRIDTSRDMNGNARIERNVPGEFFGQADECLLWTVDVGTLGAVPRAIAIAADGSVWVGLYEGHRVVQISPDDGRVLRTVALAGLRPFSPYGAAVDSRGKVWFTEAATGRIVSIDVATGEPTSPTQATSREGCSGSYGIAIDNQDFVWIAGFQCPNVFRYDPFRQSWLEYRMPSTDVTRGIASDAQGNIYVAASHAFVTLGGPFGATLGDPVARLFIIRAGDRSIEQWGNGTGRPLPGLGSTGVGLDGQGRVWLVNAESGSATRIDLATRETREFPVGTAPYTYSDFTGYALRTFTAPNGSVREVAQGCPAGPTTWQTLQIDADVPPGSRIEVRLRTAASQSALQTAVFGAPIRVFPADLASLGGGGWIEAELTLVSEDRVTAPVVRSLTVNYRCL